MERKEYTFKVIDEVSIAADVYYNISARPTGDTKLPIALHFHGGSFVVGSKNMLEESQTKKLLDLGFVVVSSNYRLCPTTTVYDGPVTDSLDAYRWVQDDLAALLKKDIGIEVDGAKVVVLGHSCGGTLALLTGGLPNPPLAIVDFYGMKYLQDSFYHEPLPAFSELPPPDKSLMDQVFKDTPPPTNGPTPVSANGIPNFGNPRVAWMLNTLAQGTHMKAVMGDNNYDRVDPSILFSTVASFPPTYIVHGTVDKIVDPKFSIQAHAQLKKRGFETVLDLVEGADHAFDASARPGDDNFDVVIKAFEFLKRHAQA
ncbi:Alpha/Beta hydrolase protein [Xylaria digitata]|nr:Alpha/Beta hydrolase protein [Xylaria digitata]